MKVVFIIESMVLIGGTEKIIVEKANYLSDKLGYDTTIISCTQPPNQPNAFSLAPGVKQINLNIPYYKQYRYRYPKRLWMKIKVERELKKILSETVNHLAPDILIGILCFKADIVSKIKCQAKKIIECHEARYYSLADIEHNRSFFSNIFMNYYKRNKYFRTIEKHADIVVTLTEGDKALWKKAKRVEVIPNFSTMQVLKSYDCKQKRIIAVGRLSPEKGYERLLDIWEQVSPHYPEWQLDIYGEGKMRDSLNCIITSHNIRNINIRHASAQISQEYAKSSICVMTSYFEGFGLALLEALKHGIPCIAFDCPFGPSSIIIDNQCGYLVKDGDNSLYAKKLSELMNNESIRYKFSEAAIKRASIFSVDNVMNQWKNLFEEITTFKDRD